MQVQTVLDSDIAMQFDECTPYETDGRVTTEREARVDGAFVGCGAAAPSSSGWPIRTRFFGIVQGGMFEPLREASAALAELDLPGYAIGGVSVGEPKEEMRRILAHTPRCLPAAKPRYLMGWARRRTSSRRGLRRRHVRLRDADAQRAQRPPVHALRRPEDPQRPPQADERPLDPTCGCTACRSFSRAYLHHLERCGEMLAPMLASITTCTTT